MSHTSSASHVPPGPGGGKPPRHWAIINNAFSTDECERLNAAFKELDAQDGGLVAGRFDQKVRQSALVWLPESEEFDWVIQHITRLAADANRDVFRYALDGFEERLQLASYGPGHYYDWHIDRGRGAVAGRRKLTMSVQLADPEEYVGGEFELNADGRPFQVPVDRGAMVVFPAHTLHRVAPVVSGNRLSLVAWVHGPDFV